MSNIVKEKIFFSKTNESAGEYIYLNPMIFTHLSENEFIQPERKLPIDLIIWEYVLVNRHIEHRNKLDK